MIGLVAVPAIELLILIPARIGRRQSPFRGSPDHYALRLQDQLGWGRWRVLVTTLALGGAFALGPWVARSWPTAAALGFAAAALAATAVIWRGLWQLPPGVAAAPAAAEGVQARAASK